MRSTLVVAALISFASSSTSLAIQRTLFDQSDVFPSAAAPINHSVYADDFVVDGPSRIDTVTVWISGTTESFLGGPPGFAGSLGWAIYADNAGAPGTLLHSGTDSSPAVDDAGFVGLGRDVYRAQIDLNGLPNLDGTYWFALHEGPWLSQNDGTFLFWYTSDQNFGASIHYSTDEQNPVVWISGGGGLAMTIEGDEFFWHQGTFATNGYFNISGNVGASDILFPESIRLGSLDVWLSDNAANDDGVLGSFDGTLSWAIYSGIFEPESLLFSGQDSSPILADTGQQDVSNADIFRARIEFEGNPTLFGGNPYWLVLHEGAWLSATDPDAVWWQKSGSAYYSNSMYSATETAPGNWQSVGFDLAFILFEDGIFASGFEAGVACAWSGTVGAALCP